MHLELLKAIDSRDDRREIYIQLTKLDATQRIAFLYWARDCTNKQKMTHSPPWVLVEITSATGTVEETFFDLMLMITTHGLRTGDVLRELERRAGKAKLLYRHSNR